MDRCSNEDFITTRVVNYSDQGSANRYEAPFSVEYDTDINLVPDIVEAAVSKHPEVLQKPYPPDCELRGFGEVALSFLSNSGLMELMMVNTNTPLMSCFWFGMR